MFISPEKALTAYRCHIERASVLYSTKTRIVVNVASASHTSMVFFLSYRSEIAPANMLMITYGA